MAILRTRDSHGIFNSSRNTTIDPAALQSVITNTMKRLSESSKEIAQKVADFAANKVPIRKELENLHNLPLKREFLRRINDELKSRLGKGENPKVSRWDMLSVLTNCAQRYSGYNRSAIEASLSRYVDLGVN